MDEKLRKIPEVANGEDKSGKTKKIIEFRYIVKAPDYVKILVVRNSR